MGFIPWGKHPSRPLSSKEDYTLSAPKPVSGALIRPSSRLGCRGRINRRKICIEMR